MGSGSGSSVLSCFATSSSGTLFGIVPLSCPASLQGDCRSKNGPRVQPPQAFGEISDGAPVMPFKSQAQRRKFAQLLVEGKISNQTFEEWNRETGAKRLPERASRKTKSAKKSTGKNSRKRKQARPPTRTRKH